MEFGVILMNSFFSASFALFANQLLRMCRSAQRHSGSRFSVRDLRSSSPTDRAKTYLQRLGVAFPADTEEWHEITRNREIRNKIMHEGGDLPSTGVLATSKSGTHWEPRDQGLDGGLVSSLRALL